MSELNEMLRGADSTVHTLAEWLGVSTLELDGVTANTGHILTERERALLDPHPGIHYTYRRSAFLRTPMPTSRIVARVEATVILHQLPRFAAQAVMDARRTLGSILIELGAQREFIGIDTTQRYDAAGEPIVFRIEALFRLDDRPVALVREDIYESTARTRVVD